VGYHRRRRSTPGLEAAGVTSYDQHKVVLANLSGGKP
jgi:hypothetical protein